MIPGYFVVQKCFEFFFRHGVGLKITGNTLIYDITFDLVNFPTLNLKKPMLYNLYCR